ncbi:tetratricopeptide repeat protein [Photobacterium nomapromontoriensis]|uniref:tetratricopeptide repeat protein n=1 Tax=Photobacterium nomapromontoriensis TaxID=2910237 RepID=UPI003D0C1C6B
MKNILLSIQAAVFIILSGCAQQFKTDNDPIAEMARVNNYQGMIFFYKEVLKMRPDDPGTLQKLAEVYYKSGDFESASFYVDHLQSKVKPNKALLALSGKIYDGRGDHHKALSAFEESESLGNTSAELHVNKGVTLSKLGHYQKAESQFNHARLKGYDDIVIKNNLAVIFLIQGQYQKVVDLLLPVYDKAINNQALRVNLAIALIKIGNEKQATETLKGIYTERQLNVLLHQVRNMKQVQNADKNQNMTGDRS